MTLWRRTAFTKPSNGGSSALATVPSTSTVDVSVVHVVKVSNFAGSFALVSISEFVDHVCSILSRCAQKQVRRTYAARDVTVVAHVQSSRDRPVQGFPDHSGYCTKFTFDFDLCTYSSATGCMQKTCAKVTDGWSDTDLGFNALKYRDAKKGSRQRVSMGFPVSIVLTTVSARQVGILTPRKCALSVNSCFSQGAS